VNDRAFKDGGVDDVRDRSVGMAIPKMTGVPLDTLLKIMLSNIPSKSLAIWLPREGKVELTTLHELLGRPGLPLLVTWR
jgi:hypothetical protein